jgi:Ca2+/Na+ antiporter
MKKNINFLIFLLFGIVSLFLGFAFSGAVKITLIAVGVILILLAVFVVFSKKEAPPVIDESYRYNTKKSLMTEAERSLYYRLIGFRLGEVFPQVALVSIVDKEDAKSRNELFRTVDFLICDERTNKPLFVIELNDATHKRDDRKLRDEKVKCILSRAGLPLVTVTIDELKLSDRDLKKKIISLIK